MSYTRLNMQATEPEERRLFLPSASRLGCVLAWSVLNIGLLFAETLAELLAPFLLIGGALWWVLPRALAAVTLDGPANDMLQLVRARVPHDIYLDGSYYSASTLIMDGLWLVAAVAICRTLSAALAALLLDRR